MKASDIGVKNTISVHLVHPTKGPLYADEKKKKPVMVNLCSAIYAAVYLGREMNDIQVKSEGFDQARIMLSKLTVSFENLEGVSTEEEISSFYSNPDNLWVCVQLVARLNEEKGFLG